MLTATTPSAERTLGPRATPSASTRRQPLSAKTPSGKTPSAKTQTPLGQRRRILREQLTPGLRRNSDGNTTEKSQLPNIDELGHKLEKLQTYVYETINSFYAEFINTNQYALDLRDEIEALAEQISQVRVDEERADEEKNAKTERNTQNVVQRQRVARFNSIVKTLKDLSKIHHLIQNFDQLVEVGEIRAATMSLSEMKSTYESVEQNNLSDQRLLPLLLDEILIKQADLQTLITQLFESCLQFTFTSSESELRIGFRVTSTPLRSFYENPISIEETISSLLAFESVCDDFRAELLDMFCERLFEKFLEPVVMNSKSIVTVSSNKVHAVLKVTLASGFKKLNNDLSSSNTGSDFATVFEKLLKIGKFLHDHILTPCGEMQTKHTALSDDIDPNSMSETVTFPELISQLLGTRLYQLIYDKILYPFIPTSTEMLSKLKQSDSLATLLNYDAELKSVFLIPRENYTLIEFVHGLDTVFYQKLRATVLNVAKDMLCCDELGTEEVTDATERGGIGALRGGGKGSNNENGKGATKDGLETMDLFYKLPTMHITIQTQMLVEQAYQVFEDAVKEDGRTAIELYYCVRDLFDLFRAVVPVHRSEELTTPNRTMLFYNDTVYICHHLTTLAYQYRNSLPKPLNEFATLVDMIPDFRNLGQSYIKRCLRTLRDDLLDILAKCKGFDKVCDDENAEALENAVMGLVYKLNSLGREWKPVAHIDFYFSCMGLLVDVVLEKILDSIRSLPSISPEEAYRIRHYLNKFMDRIPSWFTIQKAKRSGAGVEKAPIPKYVTKYDTLQSVIKLLRDGNEAEARKVANAAFKESQNERGDLLKGVNDIKDTKSSSGRPKSNGSASGSSSSMMF